MLKYIPLVPTNNITICVYRVFYIILNIQTTGYKLSIFNEKLKQ